MALPVIDLSITLTTAERNAWATLRPKIRAHVAKLVYVYKRATPAQRKWLREHCPVLDAVVDIATALGLE